jgi:hypothetical protein
MRNDKSADLALGFRLQMVHDAHVDPADHGIIAARHENDTVRQKRKIANPLFHCGGGNGITEFVAQRGYRLGIDGFDRANLNLRALIGPQA